MTSSGTALEADRYPRALFDLTPVLVVDGYPDGGRLTTLVVTVGLLTATRLLRQSTPLALRRGGPSLLPASRVLLGSGFHLTGPNRPQLTRTRIKPRLTRTRNKLGLPSSNFEVTPSTPKSAFGSDDWLCNLPECLWLPTPGIVIKPGMTADSWCLTPWLSTRPRSHGHHH